MGTEFDLYELLGVSKDVTQDEIKKAYREKAVQHHPDKGGSKEQFCEVNFANEILSDPERRSKYDRGEGTGQQGDPKSLLITKLSTLLFSLIQAGVRVKHDDLIDLMQVSLKRALVQVKTAISEKEIEVKEFKDTKERFETEEVENLFHLMLDAEINKVKQTIKQMENEADICETMYELLEKYSYRTDPEPKKPTVTLSVGGQTFEGVSFEDYSPFG